MGIASATAFVSLDGVMQAPGAPTEDTSGGFQNGGWVMPFFDEGTGAFIDKIYRRCSAFLLGRGTYDIFAGYWPNQPTDEDIVSRQLNTLPKYVASRTNPPLTWPNSHPLSDVVSELQSLKSATDGEIQVHGSPQLLQTLHAAGVLDEWNLMVFPVTLGGGKRFIENGAAAGEMRLVENETTQNGILCLRYARSGPLRIQAFES